MMLISLLKPIAMRTKMVQSDDFQELSSIAQYVRPVIAPTFAFAFNIGYFIAIDINWFTLFDLTEHMVFAIKALPIAIGASICFEIALSFHKIEKRFKWLGKTKRLAYYLWCIILFGCAAASFLDGRFGMMLSLVALVCGTIIHHEVPSRPESLINALYWATTLIFPTIFAGLISGTSWFLSSQRYSLMTVDKNVLVGNIIFSGLKHVILFQPNQGEKQVQECLADLARTSTLLDTPRRIRFVEWTNIADVTLCPYRGRWWFV
jgi:hypothetical protein